MEYSDDIGGTSISQLKNMKQHANTMSDEIDIDYSKILDDINHDVNNNDVNINSHETRESQIRSIQSKNDSKKSKKNINMNHFVRNLEMNIDNLSKKQSDSVQLNVISEKKQEYKTLYQEFLEFKYIDIIFSVLLFMLLNNRLTIETLYRLPYMDPSYSTFPNLLLRTTLFGAILFLIKKFVL